MYQSVLLGAVTGLTFSFVALGFVLTFITTKTLTFALGEFMAIAGFVALALLSVSWIPTFVVFGVAILVPALLGGVTYHVLVRPFAGGGGHDVRWLLTTVALSFVLLNLLTNSRGARVQALDMPSATGFATLVGVTFSRQLLLIAVLAVLVVAAAAVILAKTSIGVKMRAVSEDPEMASLAGISPRAVAIGTWIAAMAVAGLVGVLWSSYAGLSPRMGLALLIGAFAVAVIGGLTSVPGVLVGGLVYGITTYVTGYRFGAAWGDVAGLGLVVLVLVFRPQGLLGRHVEVKV
ncbi:branched-chain amino acid ABC transporter permease [Ilumatobacter sp.]|uniref:branched-chain amino acid ABC transporter permease n=1 Tax=Ilumatobacter sp. TaxID=1967498 RepID=UPI00375257C6